MSTSKGLLVTGALVAIACIPIGYQATRNEGANLPVKPMAVSAQPLPAAPPVGLELENSPLLAEWRHLHDVYGRSADAMPALYKAINEMGDPFRRQAFGAALVAEWVQLAPTNGLAFFLVKGRDADQRRQFIREWLQREPKAAVAGLLASPTGWESATRDCLKEIAQQAPASLAAIVSRLPAPEYAWESDVRDAFALLAQSGLATARAQAEAMTGPNRDQALEGISLQWAKQDFNGAVAWAKGLPDDVDKNEVIRAALLGRAQVDPVGALQSVEIVPSGGTWQRFASSTGARVLQQAADTDFDATVAWATANPGHFSRNDIYGLVPQVTTRLDADTAGFLSAHAADGSLAVLSPAIENSLLNGAAGERAAVWDWLKTQPDTATIAGLKKDVLTTAAFQDPALAVSLVADVPTGSEGDAEVKQVAKCLLNGGRALYRYDELAAEAPERLRQPLLAAAFQELSGEYMGNPQTWIDRLSQLPAAERSQGAASIGRAWGEQAPEDAIAWAAALPAGDLRSSAESAAVAQWAKKDPQGALDWVTQLPAGTDKDSSATSLIGAIAEQFPQQAWDLALNMSDPAQQIKGATSAAKLIAARDPATARAWVEGSSLPAEAKLQIQTALQQSKK